MAEINSNNSSINNLPQFFQFSQSESIIDMTSFDTLYHKGKNGELRQWRTWAEGDSVYTEHGLVNGALQTSRKTCTPKNIGKKNSTTASEQAIAEAKSLHKFKIERKYSATKEEAQMPLLLPMLAGKYDAKKHNAYYFCQPKLDGVRCIARWEGDSVVLYSRQGKIYDVKHISEQLEDVLGKDDVFDGEIYIHGLSLQSLISLVKKPQSDSLKLEYHIYDYPVVNGNEDLTTQERLELLADINISNKQSLQIVLLKVKTFQDSEFLVVDIIEGEGKMEGHAVVICKNDLTDDTFKVTPKTTMESRKEIYDNKSDYVGRMYTVKYFDRTDDLIPRFPVGIAFREDLDFPENSTLHN